MIKNIYDKRMDLYLYIIYEFRHLGEAGLSNHDELVAEFFEFLHLQNIEHFLSQKVLALGYQCLSFFHYKQKN